MKGLWQAMVIAALMLPFASAEPAGRAFAWKVLKVKRSVFTRDLGMMDSEREEYSTNLVALALKQMADAKYSKESLLEGRKMIALAMNLSPRNKKALVSNFQLGKGIVPEAAQPTYSNKSFAMLLLSRGQLLEKQGGNDNQQLARFMIELASELDPKNEDAIYQSELKRLQLGTIDWSVLTDPIVE